MGSPEADSECAQVPGHSRLSCSLSSASELAGCLCSGALLLTAVVSWPLSGLGQQLGCGCLGVLELCDESHLAGALL